GSRRIAPIWSAMIGSLVILLGVYLAIESPRNSLLVSYGVLWGLLFLGGAALASRLWDHLRPGSPITARTQVVGRVRSGLSSNVRAIRNARLIRVLWRFRMRKRHIRLLLLVYGTFA